MPTYEFKCPKCSRKVERFSTIEKRNLPCKCISCGTKMHRVYMGAKIGVWKPITLEHIADHPMTFDSKKKLQIYCKKRGLSSGALL